MGQRTAIILQHVNNWRFADKNEQKQTRVFYHQWGIGRILPSHLMAIVNGLLSVSYTDSDTVKKLQPQGTLDITDDCYDPVEQALFDELDFDHPEYVGEIIQQADNNNGGAFVRITTDKDGNNLIEFAFMLGSEEGGDYKHFCTLWEWMDKVDPNKRCCDQVFRDLLFNTLTYHKAFDRSKGNSNTNDGEAA